MNILHLIDTGGLYGKERMVIELARLQVEAGHNVDIVGMGNNAFFVEAHNLCNTIRAYDINGLKYAIKSHSTDIIHTHDYKTGILVHLFKPTGQKVIRTVHGYTSKGKPLLSKIRLYETIDKYMLRFNDKNIGVSSAMAEEMNIDFVNNGVSDQLTVPKDFQPRSEILNWCGSSFVVGCMARLSTEKNLAALIEAVETLDNVKLVIFGEGPLKYELEEIGHPDRIKFAGFDKHSRQYMSRFDAYIQPSLTEGTPISVLEAMASKVPLLTSYVGGMKSLIDENASFDCGTTSSFIAKAIELIRVDTNRRENLVTNATRLFNDRYSSMKMYNEYQTQYTSILNRN